jgi:hypothetical protein
MKNILTVLLFVLTVVACTGKRGHPGLNGAQGAQGIQGEQGVPGQDAVPSEFDNTEVIRPCPNSGTKEVLLRFANGDLMAHYSHGSHQYLTLLTPGTYVTTDGYNCRFTVKPDLSVTW